MKKILILPVFAVLLLVLLYNDAYAATIPSPPTGLKATAVSPTEIDLSWNTPTSDGGSPITGYSVIRSRDGGLTWATVTPNTGKTITTFAHTGLTPGSTYTYSVHAINSIGTSYASNIVSATTFTQLSGTATKCTGLATCSYTINSGSGWASTTPSSISFQLPGELKATNGYPYSAQVVSVSGSTYTMTGKFTAVDANTGKIVSGSTNTIITVTKHCYYKGCTTTYTLVSGTITVLETYLPPPPFTAPQNLQATVGDDGIFLTWTPPTSTGLLPIIDYKIYRSTSSGTETYYALRGNVLSFTDTPLTSGVTYFYKVSAVNTNSESPLSNEVKGCLC